MKILKRSALMLLAVVMALVLFGVRGTVSALETAAVSGDLAEVIHDAQPGSTVQLTENVAESITVSKDICLDLNGHSITGIVTVAKGNTLTVKDSTTDDFSVTDGYGKITVQGNVLAAEGYVAIEEADGTSYHRLDLKIHSANLRPSVAGIYYTGSFGGDEVVKNEIDTFGTALSLERLPSGTNLLEDNFKGSYTAFSGENWACGQAGRANGTLLTGILKQGNTPEENKANGEMMIYSASYVKFKDGTMVIGPTVAISLRQVTEKIDNRYSSLDKIQKDGLLAMYNTYEAVMENWDIPIVTTAANQTEFYGAQVVAKAGDTITVAVSVRNNPGILGMLMSVKYDDKVLTLIETDNGDATKALVYLEPSRLESGCNFLWYGSKTGVVKDGTVLLLTFKVSGNASVGTYPIELVYSNNDTYNASYMPIAATVVDGAVVVE